MSEREVKCPKCGTVISLDQDTYDSIASQVKENVIADAVKAKEEEMTKSQLAAVKMAEANMELKLRGIITNKDAEIVTLREAMEKTKKQANECFLKQKNL